MAYDIGPRIGIEGEKEFRNAINQLNTSMKTLGTEMSAVASRFDKGDKSMEALTAQNEVLNKQIDVQKQKLEQLQTGLAKAAEKYGENDKVTQGWQQAVNKATADLNKMERELDSNNKALSEFAKEAGEASEKTGKFHGFLGKLSGQLKIVGGGVAKATVVGIAAIGTAAVGAAAGMLKLASDSGKLADDLITLSNKTGLSTQRLQELGYAARFVDVDVETMTDSTMKLVRSMDLAREGSKGPTQAFNKLGISVSDQNGELRDANQVWLEAIDALGNVKNETERNAIAYELFGRSAAELNPLIAAGADELARLSEEAHKMGAVLSDETLAAAGQFDDMMQVLDASMQGLAATVGVAVMPMVSEAIGAAVRIVPEITSAIKSGDWSAAGQAVSEGLSGLVNKVTEALPGIAGMAPAIIGGFAGSIVTALPEVLPSITQAAVQVLSVLIQTVSGNSQILITAGISALLMLVQGIMESLPTLAVAAVDIVVGLVDGVVESLPKLVPAALQAIVTFAQGLISALPQLITKAPQIITSIITVIVSSLPLIIDAALQIILALVVGIVNNLPHIIGAAVKVIGAIASGLMKNQGTILAFVPKIFRSLVSAFSKINWASIGSDIIKGISKGISNAVKSLANAAANAAKAALNAAKKALGISSPSTVMRDQVGLMMGAGMAEGIKASAKQVNDAMTKLNVELTDGFNFPVSGSGGEGAGGMVLVNVPLNLDGKVITAATSRVQHTRNSTRARSLGVVPG